MQSEKISSEENNSKTPERIEKEKEYYSQMRKHCSAALQKATDYLEHIEEFGRPFPEVKPGFLYGKSFTKEAPQTPSDFEAIFEDFDTHLMPGVTHWQHPRFYAYYPACTSYPSIAAEILGSVVSGIGFTWASCPVMTELDMVVVNWLVGMLGLPEKFLYGNGKGGGVVGGAASEQMIVSMMAARNDAISKYVAKHPNVGKYEAMSKLIGYVSKEAHTSAKRAALLNYITLRELPSNEDYALDGKTFRKAVEEDISSGLIPFYCVVTLGTTGTCSFDKLDEIGPICREFDVWLHVDAAYAGSSFICPENRHLLQGVECADSFAFCPHKGLLVEFDCTIVWYNDVYKLIEPFSTDATYLANNRNGVMPRYESIQMAKYFESLIQKDGRFEIIGKVFVGLVCFRVKKNNSLTRELLASLNEEGRLHLVSADTVSPAGEKIVFLRLSINYKFADEREIDFAYQTIANNLTTITTAQAGNMHI